MKKILLFNKNGWETPLQALDRFRLSHKAYQDLKMTYAGRLDPMASGLLLVLVDEEIKNKEKYLALNKEYEFEILFGVATDTYDILGKVTKTLRSCLRVQELEQKIKEKIKNFTGKFIQKYPMYSSKTVKGKQLFEYARSGEMVEAPEREVSVTELKFLKLRKITSKQLLENIERRIRKIKGDFRQKEILKIWQKKLRQQGESLLIGKFKIKCGSGTYVRGIANSLGDKIDIPALAFSIKRTKIGGWMLSSKNIKS